MIADLQQDAIPEPPVHAVAGLIINPSQLCTFTKRYIETCLAELGIAYVSPCPIAAVHVGE